jgi:5'-3' exonuclease
MQVHLVDATYELFRAWFAVPSRRAPDGREIGAVGGLLASLIAMLRDLDRPHVGCATDAVIRSFRNDLYPGYKTEEGVPEDLLAQFPLAEEGMRALGLVVWPMIELEADDALASAAERYRGAARVFLATPDKDLAQCVSGEQVVMLDRRTGRVTDEVGVRTKWGVAPSSIPDWLALVGDDADGYPGLPAWGARSASTVLAAHERIEDIPDDPSTWRAHPRGAERLARTLCERRSEALLYKRLATLCRDAAIEEPLEALSWRGATDSLRAFCAGLGLDHLLERVPRWAL